MAHLSFVVCGLLVGSVFVVVYEVERLGCCAVDSLGSVSWGTIRRLLALVGGGVHHNVVEALHCGTQ